MDVNATYDRIVELVNQLGQEVSDGEIVDPDLAELLELLKAADQWLAKGGFLPDAYRR